MAFFDCPGGHRVLLKRCASAQCPSQRQEQSEAPAGGGPTSFRAGSRHRPKLCQFFSPRSNRSSNENGAQELLASQPRCRAMESLIALVKLPCGQANTSRRGFGELLL